MYLMQGVFAKTDAPIGSGIKKQTPYQTIRISSMRIPSEEALSYIIQQVIDAGKAFATSTTKSIQNFIYSRNFYSQQLDHIYNIINSFVGCDIPLNLGFAKEDLTLLNERINLIQEVIYLMIVLIKIELEDACRGRN